MKTIALAALLTLGALQATAAPAGLSQFQWEKRVLVVFGAPSDPEYISQKQTLDANARGLGERDMVVLHVEGEEAETLYGQAGAIDTDTLRKDIGVGAAGGFQVVLIGKDGQVKLRETQPVSSTDLFGLVDSMPMRANEAK